MLLCCPDTDKPPPPVAQFDMRLVKRNANEDIQSARGADDRNRAVDDRRRVNSARMDSDSRKSGAMHSRMTTSSTSTVRLINSNLTYRAPHRSPRAESSEGDRTTHSVDSIYDIDMTNIQVGMRRAGSAPLSTINSELDDDKSIQWNLMPPSELPTHVVPPPSTLDDLGDQGGEFLLTEVGADMNSIVRRNNQQQDMVRPSSSHSGVSLT